MSPIRMQLGARVTGRVRAPGSHRILDGFVCADPIGSETSVRVAVRSPVDAHGAFELPPLSAGPYELFYYSPSRARSGRELVQDRLTTMRRLSLVDGAVHECELILR